MASTSTYRYNTVAYTTAKSNKKKIVLKVGLFDQKSQSKALKIAVGILGVESARFIGNDKSRMEIVGDGIDAAEVANLLRKKIGVAEIVSVSSVEMIREEKKPPGPSYNFGVPQFVKNAVSNFFKS
ncbi:heavy metal-associated isoprenylated plant protein 41-like [Euphorbia lathyris]|uniref:heavy metal-associated isoprenylated plant protein 41-like n=1 Tax=Euphorbia lathyris TaxID=212925 RepID=UPI0033134526